MATRVAVFGPISLLVAAALLVAWSGLPVAAQLQRALFLGGPLLELRSPGPEGWRPLGGLQVLVHFPRQDRVAPETFRCLLNGEDVTSQLSVGRNGAGGHVYPLREGRNELRVEVFGRGWWPERYFLDATRVEVRARAPLRFDTG